MSMGKLKVTVDDIGKTPVSENKKTIENIIKKY